MRTLLATLALTLVAATQAPAQTVSGSVSDYSFDYDLYAAEWETNWYTIVLWDNGTVSEYWSASPESANQFAIWLWLHYVEVKDIDIISRVEPGEWQYVDTFDKRADAEAAADILEADGLATDIRSVAVSFNYANGPYLHKYPPKIYPTEPAPKR